MLGPEEETSISLSMTPLVEGNLTIASLVYNLVSTKAPGNAGEKVPSGGGGEGVKER